MVTAAVFTCATSAAAFPVAVAATPLLFLAKKAAALQRLILSKYSAATANKLEMVAAQRTRLRTRLEQKRRAA